MDVLVVESGPDGTQTVVWDTDKLREIGSYEHEEVGKVDLVLFADLLEGDDPLWQDKLPDPYRYAWGYGMDVEESKNNRFDKTVTLYLD